MSEWVHIIWVLERSSPLVGGYLLCSKGWRWRQQPDGQKKDCIIVNELL